MYQPLQKFLIISLAVHLTLFVVSGFFIVATGNAPAPVKVNVLEVAIADNADMLEGKLMSLPEPEKKEIPKQADLLSNFDSSAKSPEKGAIAKASKTKIPRKKVTITAPTRKKSKKETSAQRKEKPKTKVAAMVKATPEQAKLKQSSAVELFSPDKKLEEAEVERTPYYKQSKLQEIERRRRPTLEITDDPSPIEINKLKSRGSDDGAGQSVDKYTTSDTGDVIDMGDEAVVSLNTRSFKYMDYFESLRNRVEAVWNYPEEAIIQGWSGRVMLRFTISSKGKLEGVKLIKSDGPSILAEQAVASIMEAAPFRSFPPDLKKKRLHIVATFIYQQSFTAIR